MGSRGRSIRLRIYFLVAIPLITMLGLFGYVADTSVTNWLNQDRAPNLINDTAEPLTNFVNLVQAERRTAVVYLSHPDNASLNTYLSAVKTTEEGELTLEAALNSSGTKNSATAQETADIAAMTASINSMTTLRGEITAKKVAPLQALAAYTDVIAGQGAVLQSAASSITNAAGAEQGLGLISAVNTQEDVSEQDAVLAGALASGSLTSADRVVFNQATGRLQDDTLLYADLFTPAELKTYNAISNADAPAALQKNLTAIQTAVAAGVPLGEIKLLGLTSSSWKTITTTWMRAASAAGTDTATAVLTANAAPAIAAKKRLAEVATLGAAGLILTLIVTILLGRSINRRLTFLRRSALTLANEQLPAVVARLRRGESVDVAAEAPPLLVGSDEIGQVGQAIDTVRQTALRSAVEEARLRQGVNDMFRNLARRNQSLLQRQLTVLDEMERQATDPDVLEDLFKMDHLTTRMRRHAEGLIILSGAAPGRSWSAPIKLIDVMRGAVAEVEDYARVTVSTQSRAALAGSAVTDVIHLLAELIENSTTLSPPFTQVRVGGETVANGFAIEIEDRGLGMSPQRLAELNDRLANPPTLNPANTEQLGLFVVGQLARRHGISITLRASPYGGTTAVALIPRVLIVEDGPAAITTGHGTGAATGGFASNGAGTGAGAFMAGTFMAGAGNSRPPQSGAVSMPATPAAGNDWHGSNDRPESNGRSSSNGWSGSNRSADAAGPDEPIRISGALRHPGTTPNGFGANGATRTPPAPTPPAAPGISETGPRRGRHGADDVPVVTGVPVSRPTVPPGAPFDVFTPMRRTEQDPGQQAFPADAPYAQSYPDFGATDMGNNGVGSSTIGNNGTADGGDSSGDADGNDYNGLPRRVRQANLAPELRASAAASSHEPAGVPRASAESLTVMRNTLSAMQRGWQQGRSQSQGDTEGEVDGD